MVWRTGRAALALLEALDTHRATTMGGDRLEVNVTFDERGYIGSAPELRQPIVALSLASLRKRALLPNDVVLQLDGLAERERHRRRAQAQLAELRSLTNGLPLAANVCARRKRTCGPQGGSPGLTTADFTASQQARLGLCSMCRVPGRQPPHLSAT